MKKTVVAALSPVCMILLLAGCAALDDAVSGTPWRAYAGPSLASDRVALIKSSGLRNYSSEAYVIRMDQELVGKIGGIIEALPGRHTLDVGVAQRLGGPGSLLGMATEKRAQGVLTLEAEAGHVYVVDGRVVDDQAVLWIEDEKTTQIVAGRKP